MDDIEIFSDSNRENSDRENTDRENSDKKIKKYWHNPYFKAYFWSL